MDQIGVRKLIFEAKGRLSWAALSRRWGLTPEYIAMVARGTKKPGPQLLDRLGLKRRVVEQYVKATKRCG